MKTTTTSWLVIALASTLLAGCGEDGPTTKSVGIDNNASGGSSSGGGTGSGTTRNGGRLQLSVSSLDVAESAGSATLTITRTEGSDGAASVTVTSRDGTATAPADYTSVSTTVSFAAGDSASKTVTVPIVNDATDEPDETFYLTLSSATGASLGSTTEALVTITDDDVSAPAAPRAALSAVYRKLHIDWTSVDGATSYRLMKDATGGGTFSQVGADLAATEKSIDIDVVLQKEDWLNTRYAIAACNSAGCTQSAAVSADGLSTALIGYLKASNTAGGSYFGSAVAISADGNVLAVGAVYENSAATGVGGNQISDCDDATPVNCAYGSGAVYVYTKTASGWSAPVYIKADRIGTSSQWDYFGYSLALNADGTMLAVGAPYEDGGTGGINGAPNEASESSGAVYVYTRSGDTWSASTYIKSPNPQEYTDFGMSVALSGTGDTLAVGVPYDKSAAAGVGGNPSFDCTSSPTTNCAYNSGAVYVFTRTNSVWSATPAYIKASNSQPYLYFGEGLALSADGSTLVAGAVGEGGAATGVGGNQTYDCSNSPYANCAASSGAAYVYTRSGSTWSNTPVYLKATNTMAYMYFGTAVAISGDGNTVAIGANGEETGSGGIDSESECFISSTNCVGGSGAVYTFVRNDTTWSTGNFIKAPQPGYYDNFGTWLALNADGTALAVAAPYEDGGSAGVDGAANDLMQNSGAVFFYSRSGSTWNAPRYIKASNPDKEDQFGSAVALSGDGTVLAVSSQREQSAASGFNGNQIDDCDSATESNCAWDAGAVYLYQ